MIVTCKPQSFVSSLPSLCINNLPLELVTSYKYLGVILTCKLSGLHTFKLSILKLENQQKSIITPAIIILHFKIPIKTLCLFVLPCTRYTALQFGTFLPLHQCFPSRKSSAVCTWCAPNMICKLNLPSYLLSASLPFRKEFIYQITLQFKFLHKIFYLPLNLKTSFISYSQ